MTQVTNSTVITNNKRILFIFCFILIFLFSKTEQKLIQFYFENDHHEKCSNMNSEKEIFTKLNISFVDGHTNVLEFWLKNFKEFGNEDKKYTIVHIDSRLK